MAEEVRSREVGPGKLHAFYFQIAMGISEETAESTGSSSAAFWNDSSGLWNGRRLRCLAEAERSSKHQERHA